MKHGGDLSEAMAQFGGTVDTWLDLSTGINPWSWPTPAELPGRVWRRLPARQDELALVDAARASYGVPAGIDIAIAAGTQALIQILPHAMGSGAVAIVGPTYGEHAAAFARGGHHVLPVSGLDELPAGATHAVIVNPNNPDGRITVPDIVVATARELSKRGGWLVIDEAFADVEPAVSSIELCREFPIVVLRSFGKFFGLAGLRLGFAIAQPDIIAQIAAALGPWPVSGPALVIGRTALSDRRWITQMRERLTQQAAKLDAALGAADLQIVGGTSLFRLARHSDAVAIHARLARYHIWTRRFDHADDLLRFGLPPDDTALARLASALAATEHPHLTPRSMAR
jgi:cobalamin biosynthetic protein CobC